MKIENNKRKDSLILKFREKQNLIHYNLSDYIRIFEDDTKTPVKIEILHLGKLINSRRLIVKNFKDVVYQTGSKPEGLDDPASTLLEEARDSIRNWFEDLPETKSKRESEFHVEILISKFLDDWMPEDTGIESLILLESRIYEVKKIILESMKLTEEFGLGGLGDPGAYDNDFLGK